VHLWYTPDDGSLGADLLGRYEALLQPDERLRYEALHVERRRREHLALLPSQAGELSPRDLVGDRDLGQDGDARARHDTALQEGDAVEGAGRFQGHAFLSQDPLEQSPVAAVGPRQQDGLARQVARAHGSLPREGVVRARH
jgi:hypothetical protein